MPNRKDRFGRTELDSWKYRLVVAVVVVGSVCLLRIAIAIVPRKTEMRQQNDFSV
jgi:uncharacterized membrane protein YqhA